MHEVGLVEELIDVCERRAGGSPVALIRVRCCSTIGEPALRQAFAFLAPGTRLDAARLEVESFDAELECACGYAGSVDPHQVIGTTAVCPSCYELTGYR